MANASTQPIEAPRPFIVEEKSDGVWLFVDAFEHLDEAETEMRRISGSMHPITRRTKIYRMVFVVQYTRGW